ncbi:integrase/recombinase XerD [Desulfonispora thiosulfatigenes DSM 11270]|uniref:Integrase/recombinase XerD n=1 Tax=Desulfonispora thiosulfatigenes DSM 11270 TaxID=656914 RepID=A0A1W1VAG2_DESTI|nr:tyrosine-type recombinase/integrase [Desulfonispora thiosulfatigenes]SMB89954.1 integrase/recombinase XerD [Desulfonispora thiosulfatigenes DSM 11270]
MKDLRRVMGEFMSYLRFERNSSIETITAYRRDISQLIEFLQNDEIPLRADAVSQNVIRGFLNYLDNKYNLEPATVARKINCFRSFFNFCVDQDYIMMSPMRKITPPKIPKRMPIYLKKGELNKLLSAPDQFKNEEHWLRDKTMLYLFAFTGIRRSELIGLQWSDIDFKNKTLKVFGKGQKERFLPLKEDLIEILWDYLQTRLPLENQYIIINGTGNQMDKSTLRLIFKKWVERASLNAELITPHKLRHTFATRLLEEGVDIVTIQELMGHDDTESTLIYAHTNQDRKKEAVDKL